MENNRASFGSNFGFLMAAIGSAVGLGNIWGFPYKMGMSGGFAFLLIYLVLAVFVGLAVMVGELAIGRKTGMSPVAAYRKLSKKFTWMGYMAVLVPFLVLCFYFVLGGMVTRYALGYLTAIFGWNTWGVADIADFFGVFICNGGAMILWTAIFIALNAFVVAAGVEGGIEKFCKIGMPALFVMLLIVIIYVAVQPGAGGGYKFMFGWNLEPLKDNFLKVLKTAAGQMFFSLSLGMGAMITYGSYLQKKESVQKNAVIIVICDTVVAIMAGMIVMPACYAFLGGETSSGPGLLYALVFIAAISSSMSLLEVITSFKVDQNVEQGKAPGRKKYAIIAAILVFVFALPVALDGLGSGVAGGATIDYPAAMLGIDKQTWSGDWLDFYDMLSEGIMMPLGAMIMSFGIGWIWKIDTIVEECEISGHKFWGKGFFNICYKFITPIGMAFVLFAQITDYFS